MSIIYCFQISLVNHIHIQMVIDSILNSTPYISVSHIHTQLNRFRCKWEQQWMEKDYDKWNKSKLGAQFACRERDTVVLSMARKAPSSLLAAIWMISIDSNASYTCIRFACVALRLSNFVHCIFECFGKILGKTTNENAIISSRHALKVCMKKNIHRN